MSRCSRRRLALGVLSSIWALAMLVLGLRLLLRAGGSPGAAALWFGLSLAVAGLGLFVQEVANRVFPARSRRLSHSIEIALAAGFVLSLGLGAAIHLAG